MKKEYWMAIITGLLIIGFVAIVSAGVLAAHQHYQQDPNQGGCGGGPVIELEVEDQEPANGYNSGGAGGPVSTKRHWVSYGVVDCMEYSYYETYQVGVCDPGELRCNVKQYKDRVRMRNLCAAVWPW